MAERKSTFISMVLTLFAVTFIAAAILGFVHDLTKGAIEASKIKAQAQAVKSVLPVYAELGQTIKIIPEGEKDSLSFFPAYNAEKELIGVAIETYTYKGFSGLIRLMVGITPDGNISGYQILEHKETPGLGSKMTTWFKNKEKPAQNIIGKSPETISFRVSKDGGDIDAITASTISSRAFLDGVLRAFKSYQESSDIFNQNVVSEEPNEEKGEQL